MENYFSYRESLKIGHNIWLRFGENASLAFGIIKSYVSSKDLRYDCEDFVLVLEVLIDLELSDAEKFNTFYAIMTRHRPKSKKQLSSVFDLLVQFFDPSLSRHLQGSFFHF